MISMPSFAATAPALPQPPPLVLLAGGLPDRAAELLREARYAVRRATTAAAVLRLVRSEPPPQLILLAESLPDQPGLTLLTRLQDDPIARAIPVLFVDESGDEELPLALGAADCVSLPLRPLVLLARVQAHLRLGGQREPLP